MSSTNHTSNYELSQFLGTDKPAWLSDYNTDMSKIDTQMKANADAATAAGGAASSANTAIGTLASLTTTSKTDLVAAINEVDSNADTAQNTANTASNNASSALTALGNLETYFNLSTVTTYTKDSMTPTAGTLGVCSITVSRNSAGTLAKIYGVFRHKPVSTGIQTVALNIDTGLRPDSDMTISPVGFLTPSGASSTLPTEFSIVVKTTGYLEFKYNADYLPTNFYYGYAFPSLYFIQNWGDVPTPE